MKLILTVLVVLCWVLSLAYRFKKKGIKSVLISVIAVVAGVYLGLGVVLYFAQSRLVYWPSSEIEARPGDIGLGFEEVTLTTEDGVQIFGWFVPAEAEKPTVLFCHGNGGNISHRLESLQLFHGLGLNCFIFDYRGYGKSSGKCSEAGTYRDAEAAYKYLTEERGIEPSEIILLGRSLGGPIAAHLASEVGCDGLVLESTFTSYRDMAKRFYPYYPVGWFASFSYDTAEYLQRVKRPVMIIHSTEDDLVPFEMGLRLFKHAGEPKKFVQISGTHNEGFLTSGAVYRRGWQQWLQSVAEPENHSGTPTEMSR